MLQLLAAAGRKPDYVNERAFRPNGKRGVDKVRSDEAEAVARFIADHGVTRLPTHSATAPSAAKIREAVRYGAELTVKRGRGRTVTFWRRYV
jgi:hypothetical protein